MSELIGTGRIADLILGFVLVEALLLLLLRGRFPAAMTAVDIVAMLLPGACLLLALRGALVDGGWPWVAVTLAAALVAHLFDLARRLGTRTRP